MSRPVLEVADIFRDHGSAWRQANAGQCQPRPVEGDVGAAARPPSAVMSRAARTVPSRPLPTTPVATGIARSVRVRRREPGWPNVRLSSCQCPTSTCSRCRGRLPTSHTRTIPHDSTRAAIPKPPSPSSPVVNPARRTALKYRMVISNRPNITAVQLSDPPIHQPHRQQPTRRSVSPSRAHIIGGGQIPIALVALSTYPFPRFPPLEAFGRRPPSLRHRRHGAGIRNPSQERTHATEECAHGIADVNVDVTVAGGDREKSA
jgi:hypothetical protein